jgi:hypothetical protein
MLAVLYKLNFKLRQRVVMFNFLSFLIETSDFHSNVLVKELADVAIPTCYRRVVNVESLLFSQLVGLLDVQLTTGGERMVMLSDAMEMKQEN